MIKVEFTYDQAKAIVLALESLDEFEGSYEILNMTHGQIATMEDAHKKLKRAIIEKLVKDDPGRKMYSELKFFKLHEIRKALGYSD